MIRHSSNHPDRYYTTAIFILVIPVLQSAGRTQLTSAYTDVLKWMPEQRRKSYVPASIKLLSQRHVSVPKNSIISRHLEYVFNILGSGAGADGDEGSDIGVNATGCGSIAQRTFPGYTLLTKLSQTTPKVDRRPK